MVNHEFGEMDPLNQNDLDLDILHILRCLTREVGRCDKDPLARSLPLQGTGKLLNLWPADNTLPSLGLDIDDI